MRPLEVFRKLYKKYGPQQWWPIIGGYRKRDRIFEICVGAILTQNTAWANVEKALICLLEAKLMSPRAILKSSAADVQRCIRSAGYFRQKTKKLKIFSQWILEKYGGNWQRFFRKSLPEARGELLKLWGIGRETADSILLYAGGKPIFVIDAYTKKFCREYGVIFKDYDDYNRFFEEKLKNPPVGWSQARLYKEFHALIVRWGKESSNFV